MEGPYTALIAKNHVTHCFRQKLHTLVLKHTTIRDFILFLTDAPHIEEDLTCGLLDLPYAHTIYGVTRGLNSKGMQKQRLENCYLRDDEKIWK